ncbi:MAG: hypothetical protein EXS32_15160 [Opitutus sp.]|nr:hypothetical protein [Opitutus sp.]
MTKGTIEIPVSVLSSVETLDELQDWLTAQSPAIVAELREARAEDIAGKFTEWKPRHAPWPTVSK